MGFDLGSIGSSISDIASNFMDDIESAGSGLVKDVESLGSSFGSDIMSELGSGLESLGTSLFNAGKDLLDSYSNPGAISPPTAGYEDPSSGWGPGQSDSSSDTGPIGTWGGDFTNVGNLPGAQGGIGSLPSAGGDTSVSSPTGTATSSALNPKSGNDNLTGASVDASGTVNGSADDGELNKLEQQTADAIGNILNNPHMSIEQKIMAILMQLQRSKREELAIDASAAQKAKLKQAGDNPSDKMQSAKDSQDVADANTRLQQAAGDLNELSSMTSNIMKLFHDTKMASIQNIR